MGLVVQAPTDALLALIAGPTGEGATTAAPSDGGLFATLMASMLPGTTPEGSEGEGDTGSLALPLPPDPEQETKTSNEAALALLTATAIVQFVPQSIAQPEPPAKDGATTLDGIEPAASTTENAAAIELPEPAIASPNAQSNATAPAESAEGSPVEAAPALTALAAADGTDTPGSTPELAAMPPSEAPSEAGRAAPVAGSAPPASDAPGSGAPANLPSESGVVRSVGNAENASRLQSGEDEAKSGERGDNRGPARIESTPRASAKGIEHAAATSPVGGLRQLTDATPLAEAAAPGAPAPVEVPPQVERVADTVFESVEVGATEARLRLDPAEMGEVIIHIHSDGDGGIRVEVRAESPEAAQLLRDHTQDLSQLLGDRGMNLSDVNVGLGRGNNEQTTFGQERRNDGPANGEFASILGIDEPVSAARHNRLRSTYNPDGAHIYRV